MYRSWIDAIHDRPAREMAVTRARGGIGRHAGFRCRWAQAHGGSSPSARIRGDHVMSGKTAGHHMDPPRRLKTAVRASCWWGVRALVWALAFTAAGTLVWALAFTAAGTLVWALAFTAAGTLVWALAFTAAGTLVWALAFTAAGTSLVRARFLEARSRARFSSRWWSMGRGSSGARRSPGVRRICSP